MRLALCDTCHRDWDPMGNWCDHEGSEPDCPGYIEKETWKRIKARCVECGFEPRCTVTANWKTDPLLGPCEYAVEGPWHADLWDEADAEE
jgi:hypothetical protein